MGPHIYTGFSSTPNQLIADLLLIHMEYGHILAILCSSRITLSAAMYLGSMKAFSEGDWIRRVIL